MPSTQKLFTDLVHLTGRTVDVGILQSGEELSGKIVNAMFDSFLLETGGKNRVIRFEDIGFLNPVEKK